MITARRRLILYLALVTSAYGADPALLNLMMPNARVVIGIRLGRILASPIGQDIATEARSSSPQLQQFVATCGFDPGRDLQEILIASTGSSKKAPSLILAHGNFAGDRIASCIGAKGATATEFQGVRVYTGWKKEAGALAFLDDSTAVAGDPAQVRAAISRRGHVAHLRANLDARIRQLSQTYDVWALSLGPITPAATPSASQNNGPGLQNVWESVRQFSGGVKFSPGLDLSAEVTTRTSKDAQDMANGLRFLAGMFQANVPHHAGPDPHVNFQVQANTVKLAFRVSEAELRQALAARRKRMATGTGETAPASAGTTQQQPQASREVKNPGIVIHSSREDMGTVVIPVPQKP